MKKQKRIITLVATLLLSVFAFTFVASAANYDFSLAASGKNEIIDAKEFLEAYLDLELDEKEKAFLDAFSELEISYNPIINTSKVELLYEDGSLKIKAYEYSYTSDNAEVFLWKPSYAEIGRARVELSDVGEGSVEMAEPLQNTEVKVIYTAETEIKKEDVNVFLNLYRNVAEYAENIEKYNQQSAEYDNYCLLKALYDDSYAEYSKYLAALEQYEKDKTAFDNYELAIEQFKLDQAAFDNYEVELEAYNTAKVKYGEYLEKLKPIKKRIDAVKLIDVSMTGLKRTVYSAVMGGTVDQVLVNESAIIAAGAEKAAVHQAGDATETVREIMTGFKACKTEEMQYQFYVENYDKMCDGFLKLTQALDILYRNKLVRAKLVQEDKNEKYVILVCQLALVTNALIDGELRDYKGNIAYNSSWKIDNRTISQILENKTYYNDDNTSKPGTEPYPQFMEEPKEPKKVEKPTYPEKVDEPTLPDSVENPGDPPTEVLAPEPVVARQNEVLSVYKKLKADERSALAEAFESGDVPLYRSELTADAVFETVTTVTKKYNAIPVNLTFRVRDESEPSGYRELVLAVDPESPVVYEGETPENYTDETGEYTFIGWKLFSVSRTASDEAVDLTLGFSADAVIVPLYDRVPTYYNVKWSVNGEELTQRLISGIVPECPLPLEKPEEDSVYYVFSGWADEKGRPTEILELTEDCSYTAVFDKRYIVEATVSKGAAITYEGNNAVCDAGKFLGNKVDVSMLLDRIAGKKSLTLILPKGTLKFTFKDVYEMKQAGVEFIELAYSGNTTKLDVTLKAIKGNGEIHPVKAELQINHNIANTDKYKLTEQTDSAFLNKAYTEEDGTLKFEAGSGNKYIFRREYSVVTVPNSMVEISTRVERYDANCGITSNDTVLDKDVIFIDVALKEGIKLLDVIVTDSSGNRIFPEEDGGYKIRKSDAIISVKAAVKIYTVKFTANGKVISELELAHGSKVTPPTAPKIASDGTYSYEFVKWDKEITEATCDATYDAVYEKTLLPVVEDKGGLKLSPRLKKLFYIAVAAVSAFVVLVVALITVIIVKRKRRTLDGPDDFYDDDY
ncbi:MAG: InlB B-repeat-containing protein [Clostridia bacterium]|nr:InlB B-repeat-containing protein [Clostridia bacterium]